MITLTDIYIYPVKSLGGYRVEEAMVTDRGLEHDRRWMLVDAQDRFLTQREHPVLSQLQARVRDGMLELSSKRETGPGYLVPIPQAYKTGQESVANPADDADRPGQVHSGKSPTDPFFRITVTVWDDVVSAVEPSPEASHWISGQIGISCRLVYMPEDSHRPVDKTYAIADDITSFSDGYPLLIISEASLEDLNKRLATAVPMDRFRPNIVIQGCDPYAEDLLTSFRIGGLPFFGVKPCARCVMTTIDQQTGTRSDEPLRTLSGYRRSGNKVLFGQNILIGKTGIIRVGDELSV